MPPPKLYLLLSLVLLKLCMRRSVLHDGFHHLVHAFDVEFDFFELALSEDFIDGLVVDGCVHAA
jgi:hypothetical protein